MEVKYCPYHIDINHITCSFDELMKDLQELERNYALSERITIYIADKDADVYVYYRAFSGTRIIS